MNKTFTNFMADRMLNVLSAVEEQGKLGYAIARNRRKFEDELKEYTEAKNTAIKNHGHQLDEGRIGVTSPEELIAVNKELEDIGTIEITVDVMQVDEDTFTSGTLSSQQMAELLWMVKDNAETAT